MARKLFASALVALAVVSALSLRVGFQPAGGGTPRAATPGPVALAKPDTHAQARMVEVYGKLSLSFEANQGQTDGRVKFLSHGAGYTLFLTGNEAVLALRRASQEPKAKRQKAKVAQRAPSYGHDPRSPIEGQTESMAPAPREGVKPQRHKTDPPLQARTTTNHERHVANATRGCQPARPGQRS